MTGIGNGIFSGDLSIGGVKENKVLTMTKVTGNGGAHSCNCNFHSSCLLFIQCK